MSDAKEKLLNIAKRNYRFARDVLSEQRRREREDLEFQVPEKQWTEQEWYERGGGQTGGPMGLTPTTARPTLSISKIDQPISNVLNQERNALLGVNIHPVSPDADDDKAEIYQGLYRQIERESRAPIGRSWAFNRAVKAGWGAYRITTRYADDVGGDPFDQRISIDRILHQDSVYFDPASQAPDFSDAGWAFITSWVPYERFVEMYPKSKYATPGADDTFGGDVFEDPEWVKREGENGKVSAVQVAEYFYREYEDEKLLRLETGETVREIAGGYEMLDGTALPEQIELEGAIERVRKVPKVKWAKMTGSEVLEEAPWAGKYIPIVGVIGHELIPFDDKRRWHGMIRPARDAQRLFNYAASGLVETAALEPKSPYVADKGQIEGYEEFWEQANTRSFSYLPYNAIINGQLVPRPERSQIDSSRLGPNMMLIQNADEFIQSTMMTYAPSLGRFDSRERSGKAIERLQEESQLGNSDYLHQMATVSMTYEAMVVLDLIPHIYDRPGRIVRTRDDEENTSTTMLNQKFIVDPRTQQPVPFVEGMPLPPSRPPTPNNPNPPPAQPKEYNLAGGVYGVSVTIGKAYPTRMAEGHAMLARVAESSPDLMPVIGPELFEYSDWPAAKIVAENLKKLRNQKFPILAKKDDGSTTKEEAEARAAALEQQLQQMGQQLQQARQDQESDMAKQQATLAKAKLDSDTKLQLAQLKAANDMQLAQLKAMSDEQASKLDNLTRLLVASIESKDNAMDREHTMRERKFDAHVDLKRGDVESARARPEGAE